MLALTKLKANADNKRNTSKTLKFVSVRVENNVEKRKKCLFPAFSPFPTISFFKRLLSQGP